MPAIAFDTLKFVNKLKAAGVPEKQAEAIAEAFQEASGEAELATKRDIEHLEAALKRDIERLEADLGAKIDRVQLELRGEIGKLEGEIGKLAAEIGTLKWLAGLIGAGVLTLILRAFFA